MKIDHVHVLRVRQPPLELPEDVLALEGAPTDEERHKILSYFAERYPALSLGTDTEET